MTAWPLDSDMPSDAMHAVERTMDRLIREYGSGFCAAMARDHLATGGKRIRARLALSAYAALGADASDAVPWAAACELLHNASLVHDDLQDGDRVRRGHPALWTVYGADQAINAGDLLLMLPTLALEDLRGSDTARWRLALCVARHGARTAAGQADEMALRSMTRLDLGAYLSAARGKTAGLFGMPVEGAALLAGMGTARARALASPFETLGLVYQMQDDVIDLYGNKGRGEIGADIREGKVSALVVAHLDRHPGDRLWLSRVLRGPREETTDEMVASVVARFREGGALADVLRRIRDLAADIDGGVLDDEPALRAVAEVLRGKVLAPLDGLHG